MDAEKLSTDVKQDLHLEEDVVIDPVAERRLLWKMDLYLVVS